MRPQRALCLLSYYRRKRRRFQFGGVMVMADDDQNERDQTERRRTRQGWIFLGSMTAVIVLIGTIAAMTGNQSEPGVSESTDSEHSGPQGPSARYGSASEESEQNFLLILSSQPQGPILGRYRGGPQQALTDGYQVCTDFDNGREFMSITGDFTSGGFSAYQSGFIVVAAVRELCPEYIYLLGG